jgi:hypothetical protein
MHVARAEWASAKAEGGCYLQLARGVALEVKHVGVRRGQFTALVTFCLRVLPWADSTWYVD